jgi:hypothetical protein
MLCKITDHLGQTRHECQWGENVTKVIEPCYQDAENPLCTCGWFHYYPDELTALIFNRCHADFDETDMQLWQVEVNGLRTHDDNKCGCTELTTIKRIKFPKLSRQQRIAYTLYTALELIDYKPFVDWANNWLAGEGRNEKTNRLLYNKIATDDKLIWEDRKAIMLNCLDVARWLRGSDKNKGTLNRLATYAASDCYTYQNERRLEANDYSLQLIDREKVNKLTLGYKTVKD